MQTWAGVLQKMANIVLAELRTIEPYAEWRVRPSKFGQPQIIITCFMRRKAWEDVMTTDEIDKAFDRTTNPRDAHLNDDGRELLKNKFAIRAGRTIDETEVTP